MSLTNTCVGGGFFDVGRLVDYDRRIAGADSVGRFSRTVSSAHHGRSACSDRQVANRHQFLSQRNAGPFETLNNVFRRTLLLQSSSQYSSGFQCSSLRQRVRRKDHGVAAFQRVDGHVDHCHQRVGYGTQSCNYTDGLTVLDESFLWDLLDNTDCFLPQGITEYANDLEAPSRHSVEASHLAFVNAHPCQTHKGRLVCCSPTDSLTQAIDSSLIVIFAGLYGGTRPLQEIVRVFFFFWSDSSCHQRLRIISTMWQPWAAAWA